MSLFQFLFSGGSFSKGGVQTNFGSIPDKCPQYPLGTVVAKPLLSGRYSLCRKSFVLGPGCKPGYDLVPIDEYTTFSTVEEAKVNWLHSLQEPTVIFRPDES